MERQKVIKVSSCRTPEVPMLWINREGSSEGCGPAAIHLIMGKLVIPHLHVGVPFLSAYRTAKNWFALSFQ
jgi:hypothetical protein